MKYSTRWLNKNVKISAIASLAAVAKNLGMTEAELKSKLGVK